MTISSLLRSALLAVTLATSSSYLLAAETEESKPAANADTEHKFELAKQYYGQCVRADAEQFDKIRPHLKAFTDMEVMAETMADPVKFVQLMSIVNDPHTLHVMTKCATEPVMWDTWVNGMTDFGKMTRAMTHFMNPNVVFAWMSASMNPATYQPMMKMSDPAYYQKWMTAMMNPVFYQPVTSLMDPNWYAPRVNWMMNPQSMQPFFNVMAFDRLAANAAMPQASKAVVQTAE